jgi:hypothetical protein
MAIGTVERFRESLDGHDVTKDNPKMNENRPFLNILNGL